jgi:hypothetical protein
MTENYEVRYDVIAHVSLSMIGAVPKKDAEALYKFSDGGVDKYLWGNHTISLNYEQKRLEMRCIELTQVHGNPYSCPEERELWVLRGAAERFDWILTQYLRQNIFNNIRLGRDEESW